MRFTLPERWLTLAVAAAALAASPGCQRLPYIDQDKDVPRDVLGRVAEEDREVKQAAFTGQLPMSMPRVSKPRTTSDPEAQEIWPMTLQEAIRIGLDNSEVIRVISLGAQGIPVGGFEPTPLNTGAGGGISSALGAGTLATVYDPGIQETQIAQALSVFDANLSTSLFWGRSETPLNNGFAAGSFSGANFPVIFNQETAQYQATLQKRTAVGSILSVQHNINFAYSNSPTNVTPSAYTTNTQLRITQPLLGGTAQNPSGLEANRAPIVIARLNADSAVWRFKAEVMASVRSIEQQYWALSQQHVEYWSRTTAVDLGEEIVKREEAELEVGRGTIANVAEARSRLEQFRLDLLTSTSSLITTERQLRNILGLPPTDNRRIIPVTPPVEARLEPNWEASLAQMLSFQPDIVNQQLLVRLSELQLLSARNQLLPVLNLDALYQFNGLGENLDSAEAVGTGAGLRGIDPRNAALQRAAGLNSNPSVFRNFQQWQVGLTFQMPLGFRGQLAQTRQAQYNLLRQRAYLQQIVHQTTHSLSRFFLEVDANYKQFKTAGRLRVAAEQRLDAQRAFYENGRITIDRYLEAINLFATAVAQEAQFKSTYNTAIAALEEAKGTLLAYDNIAVAEGPNPRQAYIQAIDQQKAHRTLPISPDGPYIPEPRTGAPIADPVEPQAPPDQDPPGELPPLPAPVGPVGPPPTPAPPFNPAGEVNSQVKLDLPPLEPEVKPASATGPAEPPPREIPIDLPPLPPE